MSKKPQPLKPKSLPPRNVHNGEYDFTALMNSNPALKPFIIKTKTGTASIDFANAEAVTALNAALLTHHYGINNWSIPQGALCPPIPGRVDYIHHVADLLGAEANSNQDDISLLDIGTGANGVYALLASQAHGWKSVGSDISQEALDNVSAILDHNPTLKKRITLRRQADKHKIFEGIIQPGEFFHVTVCNPPFHASADEALKHNQRKQQNLAKNRGDDKTKTTLNFGGQANELWCNGGERLFLKKMIKESLTFAEQVGWFTSLVSKSENLKPSVKLIRKLGASDVKEIEMVQGNKVTRVLVWRY